MPIAYKCRDLICAVAVELASSARNVTDHGEASGFGQNQYRGVEVSHTGGQGGGCEALGQCLAELEAGQRAPVHIGQAQAFSGVSRPGLPHLKGKVTAQPETGVTRALHAIGQVGQGRGKGGVGSVARPGPPPDVFTITSNDGARRVHSGNVLVTDFGQDPLGPLGQSYRRVRSEQDLPGCA